MPLTPFHLGPHALVGLPFGRRIDLPVFLLANVFIDLEPLTVMVLGLDYPLHGLVHSLLLSLAVTIPLSLACFPLRDLLATLMAWLRLPYATSRGKMVLSGVLGGWLHILTDTPIYIDIRPLWPSEANPLFRLIAIDAMYRYCLWALVAAALLYLFLRYRQQAASK